MRIWILYAAFVWCIANVAFSPHPRFWALAAVALMPLFYLVRARD
jgi:hypothetical protein